MGSRSRRKKAMLQKADQALMATGSQRPVVGRGAVDSDVSVAVPAPESQGGAGALLADYGHLRSDARLVKRMLTLGVITEERAGTLIQKGFDLAEKCKSPRNFKAAMSVPIELLKIEQRERFGEKDASPNQTNVSVNVGVGVQVPVQQRLNEIEGHEPDYIEWRNDRALRQRVDPAVVGCNGFAEQILGPASSADPEPGSDADDSGS